MKKPRTRRTLGSSNTADPRRVGVAIRRATIRDAATIVRMIRGLAEYEKLLREAKATVAAIRRDGFGKRRFFQVLLAERRERRSAQAVGFALYFFAYSTFLAKPTLYLEDLFVLPEERGNGTGMALMRALAREALRNGCGRMAWQVLDWNRPSIDFYKRLGAELHADWIPTRLTGRALSRLAHAR